MKKLPPVQLDNLLTDLVNQAMTLEPLTAE